MPALPVLLSFLGSCSLFVPSPEPEDWLGVGFRTPEQTFRTFQVALAGDRPELEYRCLSGAMKRREELSSLAYREFRQELLDEMPWLRFASRAEIVEVQALDGHHSRVVARIDWLFVDETFAVDMLREDFYELRRGDELLDDDVYPFAVTPRADRASLTAEVPWADHVVPDAVTEIRVGQEWKIDRFTEIAPPEP